MRRDWFRHRVLRPAVEEAGLEWRVRVHDLRHASASWALADGATVQQVREHLGHVSLRAVERYLHSLPGADNGAAGAIARVKETGALYPVITPSYTPAPPTMAAAAARTPTPAPAAVLDETQCAATPAAVRQAQEAEPHRTDVEYPALEAEPAEGEEIRADAPSAAMELARSVPHRGPDTGTHQHPKKKRGKASHLAALNGQDRRNGDRHATDMRTAPGFADGVSVHGPRADGGECESTQLVAGLAGAVIRDDCGTAIDRGHAPHGSRARR